jgi:hypothetical protein
VAARRGDLQANLVRLDHGHRIQPHSNDEVDVLVVVVSGRGQLTLVLGMEAPLQQTLLAFRGGVRLGEERGELGAGSGRPRADPIDSASVEELGGRCRPVDGGRDSIRLRETPGNLSGSGSETHQHLSPTGANCCHSLLLDQNAMVGIDLHNRLFLLVTGRGE